MIEECLYGCGFVLASALWYDDEDGVTEMECPVCERSWYEQYGWNHDTTPKERTNDR